MRFKKPKGRRIKNVGFWHCTAFVNPTSDLWYQNGSEKERGKWVKRDELKDTILTNYCHPVRSVRAFRRRLKQWKNQLPKGTEIYLVSMWTGYHVIGVIK